jgi:hypothetical protein
MTQHQSTSDGHPLTLDEQYRAASALERTLRLLYLDDVRTDALREVQHAVGDVDQIEAVTATMQDLLFQCAHDAGWASDKFAQPLAMTAQWFRAAPEFKLLGGQETAHMRKILSQPEQLKAVIDRVPGEAQRAAQDLEQQIVELRGSRKSEGDMSSTARCALYGLAAALAVGTGAVIVAFGAGFAIGFECL